MVADFKKKQKSSIFSDKTAYKIAGIIFLIIVVSLFFANLKIYQKKKELIAQVASYKKQIEEIKKNNQKLKEEIANSDNQDYLEKVAREEQDMQKSGENQVIFIAPPKKTESAAEIESFWSTKYWFGWIGQSWSWIKNKF